jgi:hypothetical protein
VASDLCFGLGGLADQIHPVRIGPKVRDIPLAPYWMGYKWP